MTEDETAIDRSAFLARVAERRAAQRANADSPDLNSMVGYSTPVNGVGTVTAPPPARPHTNGTSVSAVRQPPRIPKIQGLKPISQKLENTLRRDAEEMFEDFHTEKSELDHLVDAAIDATDVLEAYRLWIGKMEPKVYNGQTESIKISCPIPGHEDNDPSAWINTVKGEGGLWHCGGCSQGGDKYDLAAIGLGFSYPGYKSDGSFRDLKLAMARSLGVDVDAHLLGPKARAYMADKKEQQNTQANEASPSVEVSQIPTQTAPIPSARTERPKARSVSNEEALAAMYADSQRDWDERMHKYYPGTKKKEKKEEQKSPNQDTQQKSIPESTVTKQAAPAPPIMPGIGMPILSGLGSVSPINAPEEANHKEDGPTEGDLAGFVGMSFGSEPTTSASPAPSSAMQTLPMLGGMPRLDSTLFIREATPKIDTTDPGFIKAMLEDEGIKTEYEEPDESEYQFARLDFRLLVPENTFIGTYCNCLLPSDSPDEWNFWNAMAALSVAVGRRLSMQDRKLVYANLFISLLGETTAGKSIAKGYITRLLKEALPWIPNDPGNTAPRIISGTASGEKLITKFSDEIRDPAKPSVVLETKPVSGLIEYDEFATVMAKASSPGSIFVTILQGLFDGYNDVESSSFHTGDKVAKDHFASMLTSTQPSMMQRLIGREHVDNGFMNRMIFAPATAKVPSDDDILGGSMMDVSAAGPFLLDVHRWAVENAGNVISWEPGSEALKLGRQFIRDQVIPDKENGNKLVQRADLIMKKLMMLFTLNLRMPTVPLAAVEAAIKVYPYLMDSYSILDNALTATESSELHDKIIRQIGRLTALHGKPPSKSELHDALGRRKVEGDTLIRALKTLCELGNLREIKWPLPGMPQVGRKSVRYGLASED